jgi:hypothetical protein
MLFFAMESLARQMEPARHQFGRFHLVPERASSGRTGPCFAARSDAGI